MGDLLMEEAPMVNHLMANHLAMDMVNLLMEEEDLDLMEEAPVHMEATLMEGDPMEEALMEVMTEWEVSVTIWNKSIGIRN